MEYGITTNIEDYSSKDSMSQYANPACPVTTVPAVDPSTAVNAISKGSTLTGAEFAHYTDPYSQSYVTSTTGQTTPNPIQIQSSILGESVSGGVAFPDSVPPVPVVPVGSVGMVNQMAPLAPAAPLNGEGWILVPPPRTAPPPRLRERPIGCKTIFVGGLPKTLAEKQERAEEVLKAIFTRFDAVREVRVNQRQFAHVRFYAEEATVAAVVFSGYRLMMDGMDDKMHTGRLHVDYACNREDIREWEAYIRALERERRLQERMNPSSPTPVTPFSDTEVSAVTEMIKSSETFEKGSVVLYTWMDRGELSRRNANQFYSLIQCANSHIRQLVSEKKTYQDELESAKFTYAHRMSVIIRQFGQIQHILQAASKQKCWDHFSKPQRKNLETWRKHCEELVIREQNQHLESRQEDEMDLSDSDSEMVTPPIAQQQTAPPSSNNDYNLECSSNRSPSGVPQTLNTEKELSEENQRLREQVTTLQQQLMRVITSQSDEEQPISKRRRVSLSSDDRNESTTNKENESINVSAMELEMISLKQALHGTQQNLLAMQKQLSSEISLRQKVESQLAKHQTSSSNDEGNAKLTTIEIRTICLLSTLLQAHPFGASLDSICVFLRDAELSFSPEQCQALLKRFPQLFTQTRSGKWKFDPSSNHEISDSSPITEPIDPQPVEMNIHVSSSAEQNNVEDGTQDFETENTNNSTNGIEDNDTVDLNDNGHNDAIDIDSNNSEL